MGVKKLLAVLLTLAMAFSLLPAAALTAAAAGEKATYAFWDLRNEDNIDTKTLTVKLDGKDLAVTHYTGYYAEKHNSDQQKINIYVPANATKDTAILLQVNNSGWRSNSFPTNTITDGQELSSDGSSVLALALERGMVVVSYGARSRGDTGADGEYLGHSPATMTDTKAAIRFVRYNYDVAGGLLAGRGNPDYMVVTGTSGGGALSSVLAASGNSPDYFPSLYEIGAAGVTYEDGAYASDPDVGDELFGTIAYCPITDLPMADQAYEWTYNATRAQLDPDPTVNGAVLDYTVYAGYCADDGAEMPAWSSGYVWDAESHAFDGDVPAAIVPVMKEGGGVVAAKWDDVSGAWMKDDAAPGTDYAIIVQGQGMRQSEVTLETYYQEDTEDNPVMTASAQLGEEFAGYINGLNLENEDGEPLKAEFEAAAFDDGSKTWTGGSVGGTFADAMHALLDAGVAKANAEFSDGTADMSGASKYPMDGYDWLNDDQTAIDDYADHLLWVANQTELKIAPAFGNMGTTNASMMNENNLVGTAEQEYSFWHQWAWDNAADDTITDSQSWDDFLQTEDGKLVAMQAKMTTPIPYLLGGANIPYLEYAQAESSDVCDVAPYWYVRHGMADRDTSFAIGTLLYYSLLSNDAVKDVNFNFAWLQPHSGNYDSLEAFAWLDKVLKDDAGTTDPTPPSGGGSSDGGSSSVKRVTVSSASNGKVTVSPSNPSKGDKVTVTAAPNDGYELSSLTITDRTGKRITYTDNGDGTYAFTYGGSPVTVKAVFAAAQDPGATAGSTPFLDVRAGDWFYDAVCYVYEHDLMNGVSGSSFTPGGTASRAMIITVLYRLAGEPAVSGAGTAFTDLSQSWYQDAVQWGVDHGITTGTSAATFAPDDVVTREQVAVFLYRFAQYLACETDDLGDLSAYSDAEAISSFAVDAMAWANGAGLMTGTTRTTLSPAASLSRAELATLLSRFCQSFMDLDG